MRLTVTSVIHAPIAAVWAAYNNPDNILQWNAASEDWHTTSAVCDLKAGGKFCFRMEAKDGSAGFDFEGVYSKVIEPTLIAYTFGDRTADVTFVETDGETRVTVSFDSENSYPVERQQQGWQAILDNFKKHVESKS